MFKPALRRRSALLFCASALAIASVSTPSKAEQQLFNFYVNGIDEIGQFGSGVSGSYVGKGFDTNFSTGPGDEIDNNTLPGGWNSSSSAPGALSEASGNGFGTAGNSVTGHTANDAYDGYGGIGLEGMTHFGGLTVTRNVQATRGPGGTTTLITTPFRDGGIANAVRWVDTFTNETNSTVSGTLAWANNLGSDSNTTWVAVGPDNTYLVSTQSNSADPVITHIFGNNAYTATEVVLDYPAGDDNPIWKFPISVAPGETVRLVVFNVLTADIATFGNTLDSKQGDIELGQELARLITNNGNPLSINSPFFTGLTAEEILTIRNFSFATGMPEATAESLSAIGNAVPAQITTDILTELSNLRLGVGDAPAGIASASTSGAAGIRIADAYSGNTMSDAGRSLIRLASASGEGAPMRRNWSGNGWRAFGLVSGFTGRRGATGSVAGVGYDGFSTTFGGDYLFTPQTRIGGALSYAEANSDVKGNLGNSDVSAYMASLYMSHSFTPALYLDAVGLVGWNDYDYRRAQGPATAHGETGGLTYGVSVVTGFDVPVTSALKAGPYLSASYTDTRINGYTETGAGIGNLQVDEAHIHAGAIEAGAKASYSIARSWGTLVPEARLGVRGALGSDTTSLTAQFVGTPSSLTGTPFRKGNGTAVVAGLGVAANVSDSLELKLAYTGTYGRETEHNTLSLRAILSF